MADGLRGGGGYAKIDLLYRKRTREGGWVEEGGGGFGVLLCCVCREWVLFQTI